MATPKYKRIYEEMLEKHKDTFDQLKTLPKDSEEYRDLKMAALRIVRQAESSLCGRTESTKYSMYSANLADKLTELVMHDYPEVFQS
jgi:hypothetical protein